jgi:6-phosphogluconolactonase
MTRSTQADIRIYPEPQALTGAAAVEVVRLAREAMMERGRFTIALSGGSTPRALYEALARDHREAVEWAGVHLFWGDERCVPPDHAMSNERMVRMALVRRVPLVDAHVHPIDADAEEGPEHAARAYEAILRSALPAEPGAGFPAFDLVLLGMGTDGHTASLFPGNAAFAETRRWVMPAIAPESYDPRHRITITLPVINHARRVMFLVAGADKRETLRAVLGDPDGVGARFPAAHVRPLGGLTWLVDAAAAP